MKRFIAAIVLVSAIMGIAVSVINFYILYVTRGNIRSYDELKSEGYDVILVLGAGLRSDGTPCDMLRDRLDMAVLLYSAGVADKIYLSGDRAGDHYDEAASMRAYCIAAGVDETDIETDGKGYSTYDSLNNAKFAFPDRKILVVTQHYHLSRALFIGKKMNIDVTGAYADFNAYYGQTARNIREVASLASRILSRSVFKQKKSPALSRRFFLFINSSYLHFSFYYFILLIDSEVYDGGN